MARQRHVMNDELFINSGVLSLESLAHLHVQHQTTCVHVFSTLHVWTGRSFAARSPTACKRILFRFLMFRSFPKN